MAAGHHTSLDISWFHANERWHYAARSMDPSSVDLQIRWLVSYKRLLTVALTELSSKAVAGEIEKEDFVRQYHDLMDQVAAWGQHLVPLTKGAEATEPLPHILAYTSRPDGKQTSTDSSKAGEEGVKREEEDAGWPEGVMRATHFYLGSAWGVNLMIIDLYSTTALQRISYGRIMGSPDVAREADMLLKEECRLIEALCKSPSAPEGGILCAQSQLALLGMFFRDQPEYIDWCRRKLAMLEDVG